MNVPRSEAGDTQKVAYSEKRGFELSTLLLFRATAETSCHGVLAAC